MSNKQSDKYDEAAAAYERELADWEDALRRAQDIQCRKHSRIIVQKRPDMADIFRACCNRYQPEPLASVQQAAGAAAHGIWLELKATGALHSLAASGWIPAICKRIARHFAPLAAENEGLRARCARLRQAIMLRSEQLRRVLLADMEE